MWDFDSNLTEQSGLKGMVVMWSLCKLHQIAFKFGLYTVVWNLKLVQKPHSLEKQICFSMIYKYFNLCG